MKKIISLIVLIVVIAVFALWIMKTPIISAYLSKKMKTKVSIGSIDFSKSRTKITNFRIKNPRKYKENVAFSSKTINIEYSWKELKKDPSTIDRIELNDNFLSVECSNPLCTSNNWTDIMSKISKKEEKEKEEVIIKNITMNNLDVEILGMGLVPGSKKNVHLSSVSFRNVSSKEGFPTQQLISEIFKEAGINDLLKDFFKGNKGIDKYLNPLKKLFGKKIEENKLDNNTSSSQE